MRLLRTGAGRFDFAAIALVHFAGGPEGLAQGGSVVGPWIMLIIQQVPLALLGVSQFATPNAMEH